MTTEQLRALPSYNKLQSNGMTDQNIREFYSLPNGQRAAFLRSFQHTATVITPKVVIVSNSTQKCTSISVVSIRRMGLEYMAKDFLIGTRVINLHKLGWTFGMNTNRSRFGVCKRRKNRSTGELSNKRIELSEWMIVNADKSYNEWVNTMLHEIAHALDIEIRGTSEHDYTWRRIALSIGCDGERCGNHKVDAKASKYTLVCPNGHESASHKRSRAVEQGRASCGKCSKENGTKGFNKNNILRQVQNY